MWNLRDFEGSGANPRASTPGQSGTPRRPGFCDTVHWVCFQHTSHDELVC
jgi:hypothetical protein